MSAITLHRTDAARNMHRYYRLDVHKPEKIGSGIASRDDVFVVVGYRFGARNRRRTIRQRAGTNGDRRNKSQICLISGGSRFIKGWTKSAKKVSVICEET